MRFHRFTCWGSLTNWGWFSPQEQELLDLEAGAGKAISELEGFVRTSASMSVHLLNFHAIQTNLSVKVADYARTKVALQQLIKDIAKQRRKILDSGIAPDSGLIFPNHQPDALIGEIQNFLGYQRARREMGYESWRHVGFRVKFQQDNALFNEIMSSGVRVLYTVSVDNILTIGDPVSTKHSVVAAGVDCKAAGAAQLKISEQADIYYTIQDYEEQVVWLEKRMEGALGKRKEWQELKENRDAKRASADELKVGLGGWTPPAQNQQTRKVMLDFDSGHYAPHAAWKAAMDAWTNAGYVPRWSKDSKRV